MNPSLTPRSHKDRTRHGAITRGDDVVVHVRRDTSISSPTFSSAEKVGMGSGCREVVVEVVVKGGGMGGRGRGVDGGVSAKMSFVSKSTRSVHPIMFEKGLKVVSSSTSTSRHIRTKFEENCFDNGSSNNNIIMAYMRPMSSSRKRRRRRGGSM